MRAAATLCAFVLLASTALAQSSGRAVLDLDADGEPGAGEPGIAGIAISNGREVVETDAQGRYRLPAGPEPVHVSRPAGYAVAPWYRAGGGDFALAPDESASLEPFFFVHMSDVHAYDRDSDSVDYQLPGGLRLLNSRPVAWLMLRLIAGVYPELSREEITDALRKALTDTPAEPAAGASDAQVAAAYFDALLDPDSGLVDVAAEVRATFLEVAALQPEFAVSTGDLALEGNAAPPEVLERWLRFYRAAAAESGVRFYDTIGNNELASTDLDEVGPGAPGYGKATFRAMFGPTAYSFDRGAFHFVALDTHRLAPRWNDSEHWDFARMDPDVRAWLDADLARAGERTKVVLNHEPFHFDARWTFDEDPDQVGDDEGLFEKHGVDYVLAGHVHFNGFGEGGPTTHITTGAVSGLRWTLPPAVHPRGYRLVLASDGALYSAWKATGAPLVGFVHPRGADAIHPASKAAPEPRALRGEVDVIAVAADAAGAFSGIAVELDGRPLPGQRIGTHFVRARLDADALAPGVHGLVVSGRRADGTRERAALEIERAR